MRWGEADRAFWSVVAVGAGVAGGAWAVLCCGVWAMASQIANHGLAVLVWPSIIPSVALVVFLVVVVVLAGASVLRQAGSTRRLARSLRERQIPTVAHVADAAAAAGIERRLQVVGLAEPFSATYGALRPRVVITSGLIETLSREELAAVLAHEAHHVRAGDTAKVVVARALRSGLFALPILAALQERYLTARQLAADRRAMTAAGRTGLAGALLKAAGGPVELDLGLAAAMVGDRGLEARVVRLEERQPPPPSPLDGEPCGSAPSAPLV